MPVPNPPDLTQPPPAPVRNTSQANFNTLANAFIAWFGVAWGQLAGMLTWIKARADEVLVAADAVLNNAQDVAEDRAAVRTYLDDTLAAKAQAQAAASASQGFTGTSSTQHTISTGSKAFVTQAGKTFQVGQRLLVVDAANPANAMYGPVTAYNPANGALTVNVTRVEGAGVKANWNLSVASLEGPEAPVTWATPEQATAGVATNVAMDPLRTRAAIQAIAPQAPDVIVRDEKPQGTSAQSPAAGVRNLTVLKRNVGGIAALSSNRVTLPAGVYYFEARAVTYGTPGASVGTRLTLHNATDNVELARGLNHMIIKNDDESEPYYELMIGGVFELSANKAIELRQLAGSVGGLPLNLGVEVYAEILFWRDEPTPA